ncbi:MAG: hypothetical protein WD490_02430 [Opitutales bacterium]
MMTYKKKTTRSAEAFSLVEVVLATALFALTIVAVIGLLGPSSKAVSHVLETNVATRLADGVNAELQRVSTVGANGFNNMVVQPTGAGRGIVLYATRDGETVVLGRFADEIDPVTSQPRIAERNRYYKIEVRQLEGETLAYRSGAPYINLSVRVIWPHRIPSGPQSANPAMDPSTEVEPSKQSLAAFNTTILQK